MRRRRLPIVLVASCASLLGTAPAALAFGPGETFLTGGLDLPAGAVAGGASGWDGNAADRIAVSEDGRYVAFVSAADTLDPAAERDVENVYRKDRDSGAVVLVSRADGAAGAAADRPSTDAAISDDGRYVAFRTEAQLDASDADGALEDVYVRDVQTGATTLATPGTIRSVGDFDLSDNGQYVVFATAEQLDPPDDNVYDDVYRRDWAAGRTVLVSVDAGGRDADGHSTQPSISADGSWVAFASQATDLFVGYSGSGTQVFARDMGGGTQLVSAVPGDRRRAGNGSASEPAISGSARSDSTSSVFVAYASTAPDLDPDDGNGTQSVFRRQLSVTASTLASRAGGARGTNAGSSSFWSAISDDGARVAFTSDASNLGGGAGGAFVRDLLAGSTMRISPDGEDGLRPSLSGDGAFIAWVSDRGITADSDPDLTGVFGRPHAGGALGAIELVSRPPGTAQFLATWITVETPEPGARTISADGRYVVFLAYTSRLPGGRPGGSGQIYRRDTLTGAIELVSRATGAEGAPADGFNSSPTISGDGTRVAFRSSAQLDPAHRDAGSQVYVRDLAAGTTTLASRADGAAGAASDRGASLPAISADGRHVGFVSRASNLGVAGGRDHVYLRRLDSAGTVLVDRATGAGGAVADDHATGVSLSGDGRLVAFSSEADNLDPADATPLPDVFVRDTVADTTTLASRQSGLDGPGSSRGSYDPSISADGSTIAFSSYDETLAPEGGPWPDAPQVVARTLATGANTLVSRAPGGAVADTSASEPSVSGDGSVIAFSSDAANLVPGVGGGSRDGVFARTMASGALASPPPFGLAYDGAQQRATHPSLSDDGQCMAFVARGHNAISGTAGDQYTSYVHVVSGVCPKPLPAPPPVARRALRASALRARMTRKRFRVGRARTARVAGPAALRLEARAAARRGARRGKRKACKRRGAARRKACKRRGRRAKAGTAFLVTLTERANVGIAIERQAEGRLVGRFCRKPRPRLRRNLRCIRFAKIGSLSRRGVRAGRTRIAFSGRIGKRALKPGKYRVRVRASNAGGTSRWVRLRFRVVRR